MALRTDFAAGVPFRVDIPSGIPDRTSDILGEESTIRANAANGR